MILYGRYLSPFARRVGVWLNLQGRSFEHSPLPVRGPGSEALQAINPMMRIPTLKLDDGATLIETSAIIDWLEETAPEGKRLLPPSGEARRRRLQGVALGNTLAEKAVSLSGEVVRRPKELHWAEEIARYEMQIGVALDLIESHIPAEGFGGAGDAPDGATVAVVTAFDFTARIHPKLTEGRYPRTHALSQRANALPAFGSTFPA